MILKLLKYDFLLTYKKFAAIAGAIILLSIVTRFLAEIPAITIFFILTTIVLITASVILLLSHYQNNIFSKGGYFTNTLPATKTQIFISKTAVSMFWINVIFFVSAAGCKIAFHDKIGLDVHGAVAFFTWIKINIYLLNIIILIFLAINAIFCSETVKWKIINFLVPLTIIPVQILTASYFSAITPLIMIESHGGLTINPSYWPGVWYTNIHIKFFEINTKLNGTFDFNILMFITLFSIAAYIININLLEKHAKTS